MVKYEMIDLPKIAIIGKEGLCTKERNVVQDLWQQANSNFSDIADLGMKNADGSFVRILGSHERRDDVIFAVDGRFLQRLVSGRR